MDDSVQIKNMLRRILCNQKTILKALTYHPEIKSRKTDHAIKLTKEVLAGIIH